LVDAADSKSVSGDRVGVRFSLEAPSDVFRWYQQDPKHPEKPAQCGFFIAYSSLGYPCKPEQLGA
jgi:hypothetical protein